MHEMSPCKNCEARCPGCHGSCEKYKEWVDRYHAQQKHFNDNKYRMNVPMSPAREKAYRDYSKKPPKGMKGGNYE